MVGATTARVPPPARPWYAPVRDFWKSENPRLAAVRDVAVAGGVVLLLLGAIWVYTGQPFPSQAPLVVVESGSMMHGPYGPCSQQSTGCAGFGEPAFGRVGTIDPGDLVLVKNVKSIDDVETAFGFGSRSGYGSHGDVLIYKKPDPQFPTPVIHRALLLIVVDREGCFPGATDGGCVYRIPETCDAANFAPFVQSRSGTSDWRKYCQGSSEPITMELKRGGIFASLSGYPCPTACANKFYSGFITKGDNNQPMDQISPYQGDSRSTTGIACCPIRFDWIVGKARGEIPWFGLIKLAIYGNERYFCGEGQQCSDPTRDSQWKFFKATAPWDIWVMLFLAIGVLIAAPIATDFVAARLRGMRRPPTERVPPEADASWAEPPPLPPPPPAAPPPPEPAAPAKTRRRQRSGPQG